MIKVSASLVSAECSELKGFLKPDYLQYHIWPLEEETSQIELRRRSKKSQPFEEMPSLYVPGKLTHRSARVHVAALSPEKSLLFPHSSDMKPILTSVLVIIFTLRGIRAQTVTQPEDHISVLEGTSVEVRCNYVYSGSPYLFWYVQYPTQSLQLLLKHTSGGSIKGFTADLNRSETSFHLKKQFAQEEDSAVYYCVLDATVPGLQRKQVKNPLGVPANISL
ncbi:uncharacterized protein LOC129071926 [Pteronotus mesoamericanus]|uniref:uncharacterized protein LOC129071926 n=1 Tax=Pteronotus mesoamericanus TaxID=1884717 RepID=UPI0023ECD61B|nr:uncharacterized protein LOC129071926 [Pteronotus parnellii mesoamericanus]